MLRGVRPAGWLALGQQSWRSLTTAVPLKPFEAAGGTSQASAPYHAWAAGATSAPISPAVVPLPLYERNSLFGPLIGVAQVRSYGIGTTPLPERETIAYMRSVRTGTEVYLIGTAHVSKASAEEVKEVSILVHGCTGCTTLSRGILHHPVKGDRMLLCIVHHHSDIAEAFKAWFSI